MPSLRALKLLPAALMFARMRLGSGSGTRPKEGRVCLAEGDARPHARNEKFGYTVYQRTTWRPNRRHDGADPFSFLTALVL